MDRIARASTDERRLVFEAAAQRMALAPAVVEKDFWVCYTLDHLFHRSGFAESMVFKGGTSLSKAFGLIERFSEDIDLILDWRLLGYGENEPWEPRSNSAQERFKADSIERTNAFLADAFAPKLRATLSESLGTEASVRCGAEEETVYFDYPRSYESAGTLDTIKLEIGPMAAWSPSEEAAITPYAADVVPFGPELSTTVRTASPERTFWEKATILHQEANRPEGKAMPRRYSRHYYDMLLASIYFSPFSPTHFRQSRQRGYAGFANADAPLSASRRRPPSRPHRRWTRPSGGTTGPLS